MLSRCVLWHLNAWNCFCRVLASCKEEGYKYGYKIFRRLARPVKEQPFFVFVSILLYVLFALFSTATGIVIAPVSRAVDCPHCLHSLQYKYRPMRQGMPSIPEEKPKLCSSSGHAARILIWFACFRDANYTRTLESNKSWAISAYRMSFLWSQRNFPCTACNANGCLLSLLLLFFRLLFSLLIDKLTEKSGQTSVAYANCESRLTVDLWPN